VSTRPRFFSCCSTIFLQVAKPRPAPTYRFRVTFEGRKYLVVIAGIDANTVIADRKAPDIPVALG